MLVKQKPYSAALPGSFMMRKKTFDQLDPTNFTWKVVAERMVNEKPFEKRGWKSGMTTEMFSQGVFESIFVCQRSSEGTTITSVYLSTMTARSLFIGHPQNIRKVSQHESVKNLVDLGYITWDSWKWSNRRSNGLCSGVARTRLWSL